MYVGISKQLKARILSHIEEMSNAQVRRVIDQTHPFPEGLSGPEWAARIERRAWGDPIKIKGQLPSEWMRSHSMVDVYFIDEGDSRSSLHVRYEGDPIEFPPTFDDRTAPDIFFEIKAMDPELAEKINRHFTLVRETGERYERTKVEVVKLLDRCKSLNEAVGLFPDLRYFLNEDILERLEKKRDGEKEKHADRLAGIDTALIASAIVVEMLHPEAE